MHFQRTFSDYKETLATQYAKSLRAKVTIAVLLCLFYILGVIVLMSLGLTQAQGSVGMLVGSLVLGMGLALAHSVWLKRDFRRHPNFDRPQNLRIDSSGLHSETAAWSGDTKWEAYVKYRETEHLFLLYLGARSVEVIPKRAFSGEQLREFRRLVGTKLPDESANSEQRSCGVENPS